MPVQYSHRHFFRNVPNEMLEQYFEKKKVDLGIDFRKPEHSKPDAILEAFSGLKPKKQASIEAEFQDIHALACEGGIQALIDEAPFHDDESFKERIGAIDGFHAKVMWAYLNHDNYWRGASMFLHADNVSPSYWRKRNDLPKVPPNIEDDDLKKLEQAISGVFSNEGRGKNCKVEPYRRYNKEYFFAYPEDYAISTPEWVSDSLKIQAHHPAFEIIFVYCQDEGALDIYAPRNGKRIPDLQRLFAETILHLSSLPDGQIDTRAFDLSPVMRPDFEFQIEPTSRIKRAIVTRLRLSMQHGSRRRITLEADISKNENAVFDLLKEITVPIYHISQVGVRVYFEPRFGKKATHKDFNVTWPSSCALNHDGLDEEIRTMLAASGLELKHDHGGA